MAGSASRTLFVPGVHHSSEDANGRPPLMVSHAPTLACSPPRGSDLPYNQVYHRVDADQLHFLAVDSHIEFALIGGTIRK
ncbi:hypothetical protein [Acidipila sp. EB88]|uniref:hypothetical protein n=1 Tax=Acidipila sp. EB88 TaxID=2305226 RepID=UPI000F5DE03E|nr:hypothetical protein [Acidipila sp. EB88]